MGIKFRPMPGLSIVTLICLAILVSLGTWQYKRLQWKTALLADIHQAANAPPLVTILQAQDILAAGQALDFRRIELEGEFVTPSHNGGAPFFVMGSDGKKYYWRLYQLFRQDGHLLYVATTKIDDRQKQNAQQNTRAKTPIGPAKIIGYVRIVHKPNRFVPKSSPDDNRWFGFNTAPDILDWAQNSDMGPVHTAYYIDQQFGVSRAEDLPVRIPDIANNHLDYMLTWYSFAIILLVIYVLLHIKAGRIGRKNKS